MIWSAGFSGAWIDPLGGQVRLRVTFGKVLLESFRREHPGYFRVRVHDDPPLIPGIISVGFHQCVMVSAWETTPAAISSARAS